MGIRASNLRLGDAVDYGKVGGLKRVRLLEQTGLSGSEVSVRFDDGTTRTYKLYDPVNVLDRERQLQVPTVLPWDGVLEIP